MNAFRSRQGKTATAYDILPPSPARRTQAREGRAEREIVDAQFVTVRDCAPRRPFETASRNDNHRGEGRASIPVSSNRVPLLARVLDRIEQLLMRMSADFFSAVVALVFVLVFGLCGGFSLVAGDRADAAQRQGLSIVHVNLTPQDANGMRLLLINGIIENGDAAGRLLPPIRAELVAGGRVVGETLIAPPTTGIGGGESRGFSARMAYAGGKKPELRLSFVENGAPRS